MDVFLFSNLTSILIFAVLGLCLGTILGLYIAREKTLRFWTTYGLWIGLILTGGSIINSLIFEHAFLLDPCNLCWWQRIFLYPQFFVFGLALGKRIETRSAFRISLVLSIVGVLFSLYHYILQMWLSGESIFCTAGAASCSSIDVISYGFVTIPFMAGVTFLTLILNSILNRTKTA